MTVTKFRKIDSFHGFILNNSNELRKYYLKLKDFKEEENNFGEYSSEKNYLKTIGIITIEKTR